MSVPKTNPNAPFNTTRASHAVLTVKDLGASRAFYVDAIGLVVSDETRDALYLRGTEEAAHAVVALYLGLELLSHLDGERAPALALFDRARRLAPSLALMAGAAAAGTGRSQPPAEVGS